MNKGSFIIYTDYADAMEDWTDEEAGIFLKALMQYAQSDKVPVIKNRVVKSVFNLAKKQMDKDAQKWAETVAKRKEAGRKGGEASASKRKQTQANESKGKQAQANQADNDNVNDNVNVNDNTNSAFTNAQIEKVFEEVWKAYPEKKGKGRVSMADKKRIAMIGKEKMLEAIEKYTDEITGQGWKHFQNGSTFFHSGYIDYLPENYSPPTAIGKGRLKPVERNYDMDALEMKLRATN